uniref:Oxysterol-binding protein n=1 Tax=Myripristis murdjan TaxID=586833 RepID=A0A667X6B2_9TELE
TVGRKQSSRKKMTSSSPTHSDSSGSSKHDSNQVCLHVCGHVFVCVFCHFSIQGSECLQPDSWEIVEGLKGFPASMQEPVRQEGFLLKRRKWPMKGWHKRYFVLEKGILKYSKRGSDLKKGKLHGCIDVGLSVMSVKKKAMCIDLDTEDNIYHLKVKSPELFDEWVLKLRHHRVFRQNEIAMYPHERHLFHPHASSSPTLNDLMLPTSHQIIHLSLSLCLSDLEECESYLLELNLLLKSMEVLHRTYSAPAITALQASTYDIPKKEKRPRRWRSKNNGKDAKATLQVHAHSLSAERDRLKHTIHMQAPQPAQVIGLKTTYSSDCPDSSRSLVHQVSNESKASIPESISEFFDAQEYLLSSSSSENEVSDDDSYISDVSDSVSMDTYSNEGGSERHNSVSSVVPLTRRRSTLPSPSPSSSGVSLWNILKNNIGKDLSKVAMPVQLNEPLNTLQRLCEEVEYSELLDTANQTHDPYQRMVYVATFAVSAYASSYHRAGSKPFNPVLGETYECDRADKGFRFIAEQVSHHPPVSACHCDSKNFTFWQDVRWKNKFWGKSMEIVPMGTTHVTLPTFGDHYEWNKVTSCIHNILSGQRWIEHYGEMAIKNVNNDACQCKVTFVKAKSWSSTVNEIEGVVTDRDGKVIHSIFGKWHEGVYQGDPPSATCIWRANPMPVEQEQYYGFTQFAVELNELDPSLKTLLPPTDTRLRPDQRLLEDGNIEGAEEQKQRIEQLQRERRKVLQDNNMTHQPRFFKYSKDDTWVSNNTYWEQRRDPGFSKMDFPVLW